MHSISYFKSVIQTTILLSLLFFIPLISLAQQDEIAPQVAPTQGTDIFADIDPTIDYDKGKIFFTPGFINLDFFIKGNQEKPTKVGLLLQIFAMKDGQFEPIDMIPMSSIILGTEQNIQFSYQIPSFVKGGQYLVSLQVVDANSGFPYSSFLPIRDFSLLESNKTKVTSKNPNLSGINGSTCNLTIKQDPKKVYGMLEGPDIAVNENLLINCTAEGVANGLYSTMYTNVARNFGTGDFDQQIYTEKSILIKDGKFSFELDHETKPQSYDYVFFLSDDTGRATPYINAHYVIQGETATIHKTDSRVTPDNKSIEVEIALTGAATNFPDARAGKTETPVEVVFTLPNAKDPNGDNSSVIFEKKETVTLVGGLQQVLFTIPKENLHNEEYEGTVRVINTVSGEVMAQKTFIVFNKVSSTTSAVSGSVSKISYPVYIFVISILVLGIIFLLYFIQNSTLVIKPIVHSVIIVVGLLLLFMWVFFAKPAMAYPLNCNQAINEGYVPVCQDICPRSGDCYTSCTSPTTLCQSTNAAISTSPNLVTNYSYFSGVTQTSKMFPLGTSYISYNINANLFWYDCGNWFEGNTLNEYSVRATIGVNDNPEVFDSTQVYGSGVWANLKAGYISKSDLVNPTNTIKVMFDYYNNHGIGAGDPDGIHLYFVPAAPIPPPPPPTATCGALSGTCDTGTAGPVSLQCFNFDEYDDGTGSGWGTCGSRVPGYGSSFHYAETPSFNWSCNAPGYSPAYCSVLDLTPGRCGTANNVSFSGSKTSYGTFRQCAYGYPTNGAFPAAGSSVTWFCDSNGSLSGQCQASRTTLGVCNLTTPGTCTVGNPSPVYNICYNDYAYDEDEYGTGGRGWNDCGTTYQGQPYDQTPKQYWICGGSLLTPKECYVPGTFSKVNVWFQ